MSEWQRAVVSGVFVSGKDEGFENRFWQVTRRLTVQLQVYRDNVGPGIALEGLAVLQGHCTMSLMALCAVS